MSDTTDRLDTLSADVRGLTETGALLIARALMAITTGETSAATAVGAAAEAEAARDAAENAKVLAQALASDPGAAYDTLAELNADLAHAAGAPGQVLQDGANTGWYIKIGASGTGSWEKLSNYTFLSLVAGYMREIRSLVGNDLVELRSSYQTPGFVEAYTGDGGEVYGGIATDWKWTWRDADIFRNRDVVFWAPNGVIIQAVRTEDWSVIWRVLEDGSFESEAGTVGPGTPVVPDLAPAVILARLLLIVWHGQSLSYGINSSAITTGGVPGLLMFSGGRRPHESASPTPYASTVPWVETNATDPLASAPYGETPVSAFGEYLAQLAHDVAGLIMGTDFSVLAVSTGQGSMAIDDLDANSAYWPRITSAVTAALTNAAALGEAVAAPAVMFVQGERDIVIGTSEAAYVAELLEMQAALEAQVHAALGGSYRVPLIITQTMSRLGYSKPDEQVSQAQLRASRENPGKIVVSTPLHILDYVDNAHPTGPSYKILGAYDALSTWETVAMQRPWLVLDVDRSSFFRQDKVLTFRLSNGYGPIVVDTELVAAAANHGFGITKVGGGEHTLNAVHVDASGNVSIACAAALAAGDILHYARNGTGTSVGRTAGPRGNIRDSSRLCFPRFNPSSIDWPMDKWLVSFKEVIP